MNSPAHAIALYLSGLGLGTFAGASGWSIAVAREPASPDNAVTIYDAGGRDPLLYDEDLRRPSIQVRVRATRYPDGYVQTIKILAALHQIVGVAIDGMHYIHIEMTGDVQSIGTDDNDRYVTTANFQIIREPMEATHG